VALSFLKGIRQAWKYIRKGKRKTESHARWESRPLRMEKRGGKEGSLWKGNQPLKNFGENGKTVRLLWALGETSMKKKEPEIGNMMQV